MPSSTSSSAARNGATAGSMDGEWKAPATSSGIARTPYSRAASSASASLSRSPESTTWPGALSLATVTLGGRGDRPRVVGGAAEQREHRAAVVGLGHQAAAQHDEAQRVVERSGRRRRASAPSSPSEWPAAMAGSTSSAVQPATQAQKMAGCAKRVLSSTRSKGSSPTSSMHALEQVGQLTRDVVAHVGGL